MGKDYIYSVITLLEDALMDRDLVHRQTACTTVKHLALGCAGLGYVVWDVFYVFTRTPSLLALLSVCLYMGDEQGGSAHSTHSHIDPPPPPIQYTHNQ
jgi:hypothetical protein